MSQPRRDWTLARIKVDDAELGRCRICRSSDNVEAAHILGREYDRYDPDGFRQSEPWIVLPTRVVPLCRDHHRAYDAHQIDLLGYLTVDEECRAVRDAGGLELARRRICPTDYSKLVA